MRPMYLVMVVVLTLAGCGGRRDWEVTVENKSPVPCSILLKMGDGSATAKADLGQEKVSLISGRTETPLHSIKVTCGMQEQVLTPQVTLVPGKVFAIRIAADGKVETSLAER